MNLLIKKLHPAAVIPQYATTGAACFDLHAIEVPDEGVTIGQDTPHAFSTGLAFEVPPGWVMVVSSRSGHGFKSDVRLANCAGLIDSDFRGEVKVKLTADGAPFLVRNGDRIAQARLAQSPQVTFVEVDELSETERGANGYGSTGGSSIEA